MLYIFLFRYGSNILNDIKIFKSSANFKTVESIAWETLEHTVPILSTKSCIPFLACLSCYLVNTENLEVKLLFQINYIYNCKLKLFQLKLNFLEHKNMKRYFQLLRQSEKYYLTTNWFTKIESLLIMNILKMSVALQKHIDTSIFYELAVKCLNIFNIEQKEDIKFVFKNIIFSNGFYPSEVLLKNLNITDDDGILTLSLSNLEKVFEVYLKVLCLEQVVVIVSLYSF